MKKKPPKKGGLPPDWSVSLWITSQWVGEPLGCHARSSIAMTEGTIVVIARSGAWRSDVAIHCWRLWIATLVPRSQ